MEGLRGQPMSPEGGDFRIALAEMKSWVRVVVSYHRKHEMTAERVPQEVCEVLQYLQLVINRYAGRVSHSVPVRATAPEKMAPYLKPTPPSSRSFTPLARMDQGQASLATALDTLKFKYDACRATKCLTAN
jgi:hypothetical protein